MGDSASSSAAAASASAGESVVVDYGPRRTSCGYCRSKSRSSVSHGLWANSLTANDYQDLLDRGWRRSGCFLYKPEMERTCCPSYTIRLKASDFISSKEQARALKKMQRFLDGVLDPKNENRNCKMNSTKRSLNQPTDSATTKLSKVSTKEFPAGTCQMLSKEEEFICHLSSKIDDAIGVCFRDDFGSDIKLPKAVVKKVKPQIKKKIVEASAVLLYTSNISFQIAAAIRHSCPKEKNAVNLDLLSDSKVNTESSVISPNSIAEKLSRTMEHHGEIAGFVIKACNGHLNFYSDTSQTLPNHITLDAFARDSKCDAGCSKWSCASNIRTSQPHKRRKLEIRMKRSHFDPEEFALYRRYQTTVHKEKIVTETSYKRFLVDTPIVFVPPRDGDETIPPCGFGSFHQQYIIDGKLVAVGVVDILPKCLSSKYLFWDPDFAFLSLGKYTAIQEINWVKATQVHCPSLQYYYLGYYIHSCSKMRYKAAYRPSELLCPVRYEWVPYDVARPSLDKSSYVVLSDCISLQAQMPVPQISGTSVDSSPQRNPDAFPIDEDEENDSEYEEDSDLLVEDDDLDPSGAKGEPAEDYLNGTDVENIVLDLNGSRVKYKELQQVFGPINKRHIIELEKQLNRYTRVVGKELASHMIYSLG